MPAVDARKVFKSTFKVLINEDLGIAIDIIRFFSGNSIHMLSNNLNLNIGKKKGYNNKILVNNIDMEIGSNRDINKDHKNLPPDVPKIVIPVARHHLNMLTVNENDEKLAITLLIVGGGLIAYHLK